MPWEGLDHIYGGVACVAGRRARNGEEQHRKPVSWQVQSGPADIQDYHLLFTHHSWNLPAHHRGALSLMAFINQPYPLRVWGPEPMHTWTQSDGCLPGQKSK